MRTVALTVALVGVVPTAWGFLSGVLRQVGFFSALIRKVGWRTFEQHQIPTAWDYVFSQITDRFVIITLRDGAKLYGYIGPESYFSSDAEARDVFVSQVVHRAEDGKMEYLPGTGGVYIGKDQISLMEFIKKA